MYYHEFLNQFEEKPSFTVEPAKDGRWRASTVFKGKPLVAYDDDIVYAVECACCLYAKAFHEYCCEKAQNEQYDEFERSVWGVENNNDQEK